MKKFKLKLEGLEMLTKEQMKLVNGGGGCVATIKCIGGTANGYADCDDNSEGSDSDVICWGMGFGDSTSCDCTGQGN